jgi:hypothetical protein
MEIVIYLIGLKNPLSEMSHMSWPQGSHQDMSPTSMVGIVTHLC